MTCVGIIQTYGPSFRNPFHPQSPSLHGLNSCVAASSIGSHSMSKRQMRLATAKNLRLDE
jgi:hypothetical protein